MSHAIEDSISEKIQAMLWASLPYVAQSGWTEEALAQGAQEAGLDVDAVWRLLPGGVCQAVEIYHEQIDVAMLERLEHLDLALAPVREKIFWAVQCRLAALSEHKAVAQKTAAFLAWPSQTTLGMRLLYQTVHRIWIFADDTSLDYNFYTKRALLAGVYGSTLLYWLKNTSPDLAQAEIFLRRRIENVFQVGQARSWMCNKAKKGWSLAKAVLQVVQP